MHEAGFFIEPGKIPILYGDFSRVQITDQGSIVDTFPDLTVWQGIRAVIRQINSNAGVA